jgi:ribonuclease R
VPIDSLRDDRYSWRENTHEIVGDRTGRRFRAGDRVQVVLDRILAAERKLQFSIVEEGLPLTAKRPPNSGSKAKKPRRKESAPKLAKAFKPVKKKHAARKGKRR